MLLGALSIIAPRHCWWVTDPCDDIIIINEYQIISILTNKNRGYVIHRYGYFIYFFLTRKPKWESYSDRPCDAEKRSQAVLDPLHAAERKFSCRRFQDADPLPRSETVFPFQDEAEHQVSHEKSEPDFIMRTKKSIEKLRTNRFDICEQAPFSSAKKAICLPQKLLARISSFRFMCWFTSVYQCLPEKAFQQQCWFHIGMLFFKMSLRSCAFSSTTSITSR